ncbi:TonB-dependent receptor [Permianibacter sp. IMCC34836]|uniref:TonB-dependent receptor plug domain-containing protein n=1 Tax=Permianibacter fluminis TaxID=2738515 RepID=UPI001552B9F4|nr:TonB-dependent receptor [Permianibacter fluminis]NQD37073.1 TonB-dependent receptor [Permianibacter fluminis]
MPLSKWKRRRAAFTPAAPDSALVASSTTGTASTRLSATVIGVHAALLAFTGLNSTVSIAADSASTSTDDKEERIEVTGSRIKRSELEGPSPVITISADDMNKEGFNTVFDALRSLSQATGAVQGEQYANSFTPNAETLNLRGFGPGLTLYLLNGRRVADYPQPYNGQSNFFNLAQIPAAMVDRIEILSGGASSIYGSDAVAGVVNIITRKDYDGLTATVRLGDTTEGGGESRKLQLVGGHNFGDANLTFAYEYMKREPIFGKDRSYTDSRSDNPTLTGPAILDRELLILSGTLVEYIDPTEAVCDRFHDMEYAFRPGRGFYCGRDGAGDESLRGDREWHTLYGSLVVPVGTDSEFYASSYLWKSESKHSNFRLWWGSVNGGYYYDPAFDDLITVQRVFQPSETGEQTQNFTEEAFDLAVGFRTTLAGSYDLDLAISHNAADFASREHRFKEEAINSYFLGDQQGEISGFPIFTLDLDRFYNPLSREQMNSLMGIATNDADSDSTTISASLSGDLFELDAGAVQFASVVEWGTQSYDIKLDNRTFNTEGEGWWGLTGTGGGGERDRMAVGVELSVPLTEQLRLTPSARYDKYDDITAVDDAITYGLGLEYRPLDNLLLRAKYATSFRAPDMHYVFSDESGFYTSIIDEYLCRQNEPDTPLGECGETYTVFGTRAGNPELEEEEGTSYTVGMAWDITDDLSFTLDYYDIELTGIVNDLSLPNLLAVEAACRIGTDRGGNPVDAGSAECLDAFARIERWPDDGSPIAEQVQQVRQDPINTGLQRQKGLDAQLTYDWRETGFGDFAFSLNWTHVLETQLQQYKEDPIDKDYRDNKFLNGEARSRLRGSVTWTLGDWATTLFASRVGSIANYASNDRLDPWTIYNLSTAWQVTDGDRLSLIVNNLLNTEAQVDKTQNAWPYFYAGQYNAVGRELFLEYSHSF